MIVIDSSALMCLLLGEPAAERVAAVLEGSTEVVVAAPTLVEASIVAEARLGPQGVVNLQRILATASIRTIPFDATDADAAIEAWRRYRRGKHPAGLNLGDCYSYAAAIRRQAPLLFVCDDFRQTDVDVA